jgi:glycosyltransferase involved in cell wall biosynthesis
MKKNPLVTVLMPVYNGGEYLKLSIESILAQTYKDFEFLIINDCSTDNSMDTIRSFQDHRITVHTNTTNMGQTKSLNVGLKLAKGQYIIINDADDLSLPRRIEKELDFILKHPQYAVVGASSFIMDRSGKIKRVFTKPTDPHEIHLWILSDTPLIHGSVIINKEIILALGGYNEEFRICQDYELWSSLIRKGGRVANLPEILVIIRHFTDSTSFKEKDAQTLENGKIIYENVTTLTTLKVSCDEAIRQRFFFCWPELLTLNEFRKAEELFIKEYRNLKNQSLFAPDFISANLKRKLVKPYAKLALADLHNGRLQEARKITSEFLKIYGFSLIPFLFWVISYSGKIVANQILLYYEKWREISTNLYRHLHFKRI